VPVVARSATGALFNAFRSAGHGDEWLSTGARYPIEARPCIECHLNLGRLAAPVVRRFAGCPERLLDGPPRVSAERAGMEQPRLLDGPDPDYSA
jgi:hypothetical protein